MMSTQVTKRPKLSATTTSKLVALAFQSSPEATAAPTSPITPSGPIGISSPGSRKASAVIAAIPAAVTQAIGTMALKEENIIFLGSRGPTPARWHGLRCPSALSVDSRPRA